MIPADYPRNKISSLSCLINGSASEYGLDGRVGSGASYAMRVLADNNTEKFRINGNGHIYTQSGIAFPDGTSQSSAGVSAGKAIALQTLIF